MKPILVLVILGLACQKSLAIPHTRIDPRVLNDALAFSYALDTVISKLEAVEKQGAEQTVISSKILSSFDNILEKLTKIENQIEGLQKDVQPIESSEDWQMPTEGPMIEEIDERVLENFEKIGSKYYHIENDEPLEWFGALAKCKDLNGSLISLQNEGEWSAITARLNKQSSYWVDINDLATEGEFKSETSGKTAPFLKWDIAEPNNLALSINNENCVELRSGYNHYMNDITCFAKNYYICEANLDNYAKIQHSTLNMYEIM